MLHSNVVFTPTIVEVRLAEAPVASEAHESTTIHVEVQALVCLHHLPCTIGHSAGSILFLLEGHLSDTRLEVGLIRSLPIDVETQSHIIEILLPIAIRPPEVRVLHQQLGGVLRIQLHDLLLLSSQRQRLLEADVPQLTLQRTIHRLVGMILHLYLYEHLRTVGLWQRKLRAYEWVFQCHSTCISEVHIIPDAHVPASDGRNPVPTNRRMERGIVSSKDATIGFTAPGCLLLHCARVRILDHLHSQHVGALLQHLCHIEVPTQEASVYLAQIAAIQPHLCFPVDAIEIQESTLRSLVGRELIPIPEVRKEVRLRNHQLIIRKVGLWDGSSIHIARQHRARHRGR